MHVCECIYIYIYIYTCSAQNIRYISAFIQSFPYESIYIYIYNTCSLILIYSTEYQMYIYNNNFVCVCVCVYALTNIYIQHRILDIYLYLSSIYIPLYVNYVFGVISILPYTSV